MTGDGGTRRQGPLRPQEAAGNVHSERMFWRVTMGGVSAFS